MSEAPSTFGDGRYRVVRVLGEGAQATTFEAVDVRSGKTVAVKRFRVRGARSWKEVELAEREAKVLAQLSHPLLPRYVEHFEERGELFLVTDKIEGDSLAALKTRGVSFSERDVVSLLRDAAAALDYLHHRTPPIIHRDIKPSNVIRRRDGSFAFIDFGAVRDRMKPEGGSTVVGTFGYMAPEQFQGRALPASDVYAVGATALTLLTGREPEDLPHRGLAVDVPAALAGSRVSPALVRALSAMLVPDPDARAKEIAPLLSGLEGRGRSSGAASEPPAREALRRGHEGREGRHALRRLEREARHEERRQRREAARRERPPAMLPALVLLVVLLALTVAEIAVTLALRVAVPTVLTILSIFFGEGLRRAAANTRTAGKVAAAAIGRTRRALARDPSTPPVRVEVAGAPDPRIRVEARDTEAAENEAAEDEAATAAARARVERG